MSLTDLFKKEASIKISGENKTKTFQYPPFSMTVELTQSISSATKTFCELYNPNEDTISLCKNFIKDGKTTYPTAEVSAGYVDNVDVVAQGAIKEYSILKDDVNRILKLEIFDAVNWYDEFLNKSYAKPTKASVILKDIIGSRKSSINLGDDIELTGYIVKNKYKAIVDLSAQTKSQFALRNGTVVIEPKGFGAKRSIDLSFSTGLVSIPERIDRPKTKDQAAFTGFRIKTLFIQQLQLWSSVKVTYGRDLDKTFTGVVVDCKQKFSTFAPAVSTYEIRTTS